MQPEEIKNGQKKVFIVNKIEETPCFCLVLFRKELQTWKSLHALAFTTLFC